MKLARKGMPPLPSRMVSTQHLSPSAVGTVLALLPLALGCALATPPLQAQPTTSASPTVVRSVPPEAKANLALEAALREVLFPVRIDDGQGHGPDPDGAEGEWVKRNKIKAECERLPAHRYTWSRVDLGGEGRPELVAQVVGPMFCGTGGCPLLIFREPSPGRLQLVTQMGLFKDPLIVAERRHNGWKELITRVRVDAGTSYYAELLYDGRTYPTNPSVPPALPLRRPEPGTAYLAWNEEDPRAHALPCEGPVQNRGA
jgi:hypothetical protein